MEREDDLRKLENGEYLKRFERGRGSEERGATTSNELLIISRE